MIVHHSIGMNAIRTVGMANTSEKKKVIFHLWIDLLWFTPECSEPAEIT